MRNGREILGFLRPFRSVAKNAKMLFFAKFRFNLLSEKMRNFSEIENAKISGKNANISRKNGNNGKTKISRKTLNFEKNTKV